MTVLLVDQSFLRRDFGNVGCKLITSVIQNRCVRFFNGPKNNTALFSSASLGYINFLAVGFVRLEKSSEVFAVL